MNKFFKKAAALCLAAVMTFTGAHFAFADTTEAQDTAAAVYIPLRMAFESAGAVVDWDNGSVLVQYDEKDFVFVINGSHGYKNGNPFDLNFPVILVNERSMISYFDVAFLFGDAEALPLARMTAIATAFQLMDALAIPGVTIAVVDGETGFTWTQGFGLADSQTGRFVDEYTLFPIASTSKPFTAVAVMQLVEQGIIDLDEPFVTYMPEFSMLPNYFLGGNSDNITIRMMLSNTSGILNDWIPGMMTTGGHYPDILDNLLEILSGQQMTFEEGTMFSYANNNWTLLGMLVARMAGYDDYFDGFVSYTNENIFAPLGMDMSTFEITEDAMAYVAKSYVTAGLQDDFVLINTLGAGSMLSNAHDMAIFMHTILNGGTYDDHQLLSQSSVNQMLQLHDFDFSFSVGGMRYGLGFMNMVGMDGFATVGHDGNLVHHHTSMIFNLESNLGVFVSTNSISGLLAAPALAGAVLQTALFEKTGGIDLMTPAADPNAVPVELSVEELQAYEGFYTVLRDMWVVEVLDGVLYVNATSLPGFPIELTPMSDGSFDSIMGRLWLEEIEGEMLIYIGDFKIHFMGARSDMESHLANEDFVQWVGTYNFAPHGPGHISNLAQARLAVNELGIATIYTSTLNMPGMESPAPLSLIDGIWHMGTTPLNISLDGDVAVLELMGARFVRE